MLRQQGFTLIELIVVIIIIGILVTFAAPQYKTTREKALEKEVIANLNLIMAAEKAYRLDTGNFMQPNTADVVERMKIVNERLKLSLPVGNKTNGSDLNWVYWWNNCSGSDTCCIGATRQITNGTVWRFGFDANNANNTMEEPSNATQTIGPCAGT